MLKKCDHCGLFYPDNKSYRAGRRQCESCYNKNRRETSIRKSLEEQSIATQIEEIISHDPNLTNKQKYKAQWYQENKEIILSRQQQKYLENRDKRLAKDKENRKINFISYIYGCTKQRAKKDSMAFNLDKEFIKELFKKQDNKCALTNIEFNFEYSSSSFRRPFAASIDRIDNSFGYIKSNVRLVCVMVNLALNEFGEDNFDKMCEAYIKNKLSKC